MKLSSYSVVIQSFERWNFLNSPQRLEVARLVAVYSFSTFISFYAILIGSFVSTFTSHLIPLLLASVAVTISAWYGGVKAGLLSILISLVGYVLFALPYSGLLPIVDLTTLAGVFLFVAQGFIISAVIDKSKNIDEITLQRKKQLQFAHLLVTEQKKYSKALDDIKARDEFLSIASHELKTPLTLMLLQIQTAIHSIKSVSLANFSVQNLMDMLESVEQQTDRLSKMIKDLSNISLITTGKYKLELEEFSLTSLVGQVVKKVPLSLEKAHYPISYEPEGDVKGTWDKLRIEQVITNLLTNAIKYGNDKPILVKVVQSGNKAKILVEDHGIGISHKDRKKIFERFERAKDVKEFQGLGVGLFITNQIVTVHQGSIHVDSKPNQGSTFTVELPLSLKG